ncbi:DUF4040 domain-containing protein [Spirulina subsalsa]|uniref:DUF4040 domain-containing protein n=1 Tax=Spirulina subsalsa TaxID=54311 RepID=UPI0002EE87B8|nr:DUF4040 domain-containing protein [Spirulina subsalsa]
MNNTDILVIVSLLPLSALMLVLQVNPYHALVIRGILGAVAALVYAVLGAADVALTEALVGTMLSITLYAVAVRSSLVMRLGVVTEEETLLEEEMPEGFRQLLAELRTALKKYHVRLELVCYRNEEALEQALKEHDVHGTCLPSEIKDYQLITRIERLYEIFQADTTFPVSRWEEVVINKLPEPTELSLNP